MAVDSALRLTNSRVYWLAFVAYWGIVLFGYDTGIAGGVVSNPYFQSHFGLVDANGIKNVKKMDDILSNVVSVLQAGAFFGALGSAPISAKVGRKWSLLAFTLVFAVGAILCTVAHELTEMYAGRVIAGVGIGAISAVAPAYVSECSPKDVRGRITGLFLIATTIGTVLSYFINFGVGINIPTGPKIWRIPFGFQLVPAGIMSFGLLTIKESPRWLASVGRSQEALVCLAYYRKQATDSSELLYELAEIEAAIQEELEARQGLGWKEAFFGKGNFVRFQIAFWIFVLQQFTGQISVGYYAPQLFTAIGFTGTRNSLLASGIYGIVKLVAAVIFVFFSVSTLGRKRSLLISALGMGVLFFIIGTILKMHPPPTSVARQPPLNPPPASKAMAAMLYTYVIFYAMGWGPIPWIYVADIFPTRTRHYGLAVASASQWLWNFTLAKETPAIITNLGYKMFFMFGTIHIVGLTIFSLIIPETKGRSLEDMDVIFGAVSAETRREYIKKHEQALEHKKTNLSNHLSDVNKINV